MTEQTEQNVYDLSDYSVAELEAQIRKAERTLKNQEHMVKASTAYSRLAKNRDFNIVMEHLRATALQITLDAPKRAPETQANDRQVTMAIATVLSLLEDLPAIGNSIEQHKKDTENGLAQLKAAL